MAYSHMKSDKQQYNTSFLNFKILILLFQHFKKSNSDSLNSDRINKLLGLDKQDEEQNEVLKKEEENNNSKQLIDENKQQFNENEKQDKDNELKIDLNQQNEKQQLDMENNEQKKEKQDKKGKKGKKINLQSSTYYELMYDNDSDDENQLIEDEFYILGSKQKIFTKKFERGPQKNERKNKNHQVNDFIDENFLKDLKEILPGDFLISNEFQTKKEQSSCSQNKISPDEQTKDNKSILSQCNQIFGSVEKYQISRLKSEINTEYICSIFKLPRIKLNNNVSIGSQLTSQLLTFLKVSIRTLSLLILYIASPYIGCLFAIIFMFLYMRQQYMFDIESYNSSNDHDLMKETFDFSYVGIALLAYACLIFIFSFYVLFLQKNTFTFTTLTKNRFYGCLQIAETLDECQEGLKGSINYINQYALSYRIKIILISIYYLVEYSIQVLQLTYISVAFLILVIGTTIFPRVQLPTLIFFGVLIGVVIQIIVTFNSQYQIGKQKLQDIFTSNFKKNVNIYLKKERKIKNKSTKLAQTLNKVKDTNIYQNNEYKSIFESLESGKDMQLSEDEFKDFLKNVNMELNQVYLDQLYAHLYVEKLNLNFIQLWRLKKNIDCQQFGQAIEFIIAKKVNMALQILDVSHASLCLSVLQTLFQSIIIAWIIYSVFTGLSSSDASFDFSANSIVSLGSIVGIILSKQDKGKILEDEKLIQSTVEKIDIHMHTDV